MYPDGKAEGVGEEDRSVHGVDGAVSDVEQRGRVVEAQVADRGENKQRLKKKYMKQLIWIGFNTS